MKEITFLNKTYTIVEETNEYVKLQSKDMKQGMYLQVKVGSPRYCSIFGGEPIVTDDITPDTILVKPQVTLMGSKTKTEDEVYGTGYIVQLVDKICDTENKQDKINLILQEIDDRPEKEAGILLMLLCYKHRKHTKTYSEDINHIVSNLPQGTYTDENWAIILEDFEDIFVNEEDINEIYESIRTVFELIEEEDRKFFKFAISRWESMMGIGLTIKDIDKIITGN